MARRSRSSGAARCRPWAGHGIPCPGRLRRVGCRPVVRHRPARVAVMNGRQLIGKGCRGERRAPGRYPTTRPWRDAERADGAGKPCSSRLEAGTKTSARGAAGVSGSAGAACIRCWAQALKAWGRPSSPPSGGVLMVSRMIDIYFRMPEIGSGAIEKILPSIGTVLRAYRTARAAAGSGRTFRRRVGSVCGKNWRNMGLSPRTMPRMSRGGFGLTGLRHIRGRDSGPSRSGASRSGGRAGTARGRECRCLRKFQLH